MKNRDYYLERAIDGVSVERLATLLKRNDILNRLEENGVDNWEGYSMCWDEEDD